MYASYVYMYKILEKYGDTNPRINSLTSLRLEGIHIIKLLYINGTTTLEGDEHVRGARLRLRPLRARLLSWRGRDNQWRNGSSGRCNWVVCLPPRGRAPVYIITIITSNNDENASVSLLPAKTHIKTRW